MHCCLVEEKQNGQLVTQWVLANILDRILKINAFLKKNVCFLVNHVISITNINITFTRKGKKLCIEVKGLVLK